MPIMLIIFMLSYIGYAIYVTNKVVLHLEQKIDDDALESVKSFEALEKTKKEIDIKRGKLEAEAAKIFTLYELTKEVAKSLKEQEAFEIFKRKLDENITFEECRLLDPLSSDIKQIKSSPEYFVMSLENKRRKLGVLAVKGIKEEEKEKLTILAGQFALALRRIILYQELEKSSMTDSLTEVYTRRYFWERFEEELKRSKLHNIKLSLLMIDVDHFKKINDKYGHLAGDQILRGIGSIIKENIREIDIAGRYGGEEFCIVLPDTNMEGAHYVAERIRATSEQTKIKAYDTLVKTTLSIGIATYPHDGKITNELVGKADWALYRAKKMGRNRICFFGVYEK